LFSNDEPFCRDFLEACRQTGERAWRLPLDDDYKETLKSHVADVKNIGGKWGGAVTAAKFLEMFIGSVPWIHLDIAGPSWCDSDNASRDIGATGCFVRSLVRLAERTALAPPDSSR
jgi:leucyl aminopeptidase